MTETRLKIISIIIAAITAIISLLALIFGEGVIWRDQPNDPDPLYTNTPTIERTENDGSAGNNSTGSSGVGENEPVNNSAENNGNNVKGTVRLSNNQNISGCPQVIIPEETQISGQTTYEMTRESFDGATTYRISMWKDANYETADSNIIIINEVEVSGLSYTIDLTALEPGYTYGYNVVVDNHYSSPLLIELY